MLKTFLTIILALFVAFIPLFIFGETSPEEQETVEEIEEIAEETTEDETVFEDRETFEPVWFCEKNGIIDINNELNSKINVFPKEPVILSARLYKSKKGNYKIKILAFDEEKGRGLIETDIPATGDMIKNIRILLSGHFKKELEQVTEKEEVPDDKKAEIGVPEKIMEEEKYYLKNEAGVMAELLASSIIYTSGWGALLTYSVAGHIAQEEAYLASTLIGAGTGFFVPFFLLKDSELSAGGALGAQLGGIRGILDGLLISTLIFGDYIDNTAGLRLMTGLMAGTSIAQYFAGMYLGHTRNISEERMRAITVYSFLGYLASMELSFLIVDDKVAIAMGGRIVSGIMLAGGVSGMLAGNYLSERAHYTNGDSVILGTTVAVSTALSISTVSAGKGFDGRLYSGGALIGTATGIAVGHYLASTMDFKTWQAVMVDLGTIGGSLIGFGVGYLIYSKSGYENIGALTIPVSIGGALGFASLIAYFSKDAINQKNEREKKSLAHRNFSFELNPLAFTAFNRKISPGADITRDPIALDHYLSEIPSNTIISFRYDF